LAGEDFRDHPEILRCAQDDVAADFAVLLGVPRLAGELVRREMPQLSAQIAANKFAGQMAVATLFF
jgi:hypothetical protein